MNHDGRLTYIFLKPGGSSLKARILPIVYGSFTLCQTGLWIQNITFTLTHIIYIIIYIYIYILLVYILNTPTHTLYIHMRHTCTMYIYNFNIRLPRKFVSQLLGTNNIPAIVIHIGYTFTMCTVYYVHIHLTKPLIESEPVPSFHQCLTNIPITLRIYQLCPNIDVLIIHTQSLRGYSI